MSSLEGSSGNNAYIGKKVGRNKYNKMALKIPFKKNT